MAALLRQGSVESLGLHGGQRSSINFNLTPGPMATPAIGNDKGFRDASKAQSRMNEGSNATGLKEDFSSRLEFRIKIKDLEVLKQAIDHLQTDKNEPYKFGKEEFVNFLNMNFDKGTDLEYEELFDNIDVTQSGYVDWDKFTSYLLIMMYESDDRIKAFSIPNWKPIKQISNNHSDSIKKCEYLKNLNRYITISKEGGICLYDRSVNMTNSTRINTESCKSKDLWVTDFVILGVINKVALSFTTKEIGIYELNTKLEMNCQYRIYNLKATPLCLDYWFDAANPNDSILLWGDTAGECYTVHFNSTLIALFERPNTNVVSSSHQSGNDSCLNIALGEIKTNYKNAVLISYKSHSGWVRQIKWIPGLECVISCATTNRKSVTISWFNKKGSHVRVNYTVPIRAFEKSSHINVINGGVNGFDFDSKLNLLATANQNTLVNLFNPYVGEPNGILKGHSRAVLAVRFMPSRAQLISFAEDRILRIWNVALQICIQRIANVFPKGPEVDTMCAYDEFAGRLFISFRFTMFMMEIKPEVIDRIMTHSNIVVAAKFNRYNQQIITLSQDGNLFIWLIENGQKIKSFNDLHSGAELTAIEFDENGSRFYTGASDGLVKVWDFNGHCYHTMEANEGANCEISQILAVKRRVLAMGWRRSLAVFRDSTMKEERVRASEWNCVREEHQEDILCAAIMTIQPMFLVTGGFDGDIVVWNSVTEQPHKHLSARKRTTVVPKKERTSSSKMSTISQARRSSSRRMSKQINNDSNVELFDPENDFSKAVICLRVLNTRAYGKDCTLVSCGGNGWVRFWDIVSGRVGGEFVAHTQVGSVMMERDESEKYLGTGDVNGLVKIWDISNYCLNFDSNTETITSEPPLLTTIKCHTDQINSIDFCQKNGRVYVLTASSDCSVCLSDLKGTLIGTFGQEQHWKLEPAVPQIMSRATPRQSKFYSASFMTSTGPRATLPVIDVSLNELDRPEDDKAALSSLDIGLDDEEVRKQIESEYSKNCHLPRLKKQLSVDSTFDFGDDAFVKNPQLRYNPWAKTLLGKVYQESRTQKRERKQPGVIQSEEFIKWDRTGQAPGGLYGSLQIFDLETGADRKQFEAIKKKISSEASNSLTGGSSKIAIGDISSHSKHASEITNAFDEKSLFPKYILDYEAKMRQEHKTLLAKLGKHTDHTSPGGNTTDSAPPSRIGHYKKRSSVFSNSFRL